MEYWTPWLIQPTKSTKLKKNDYNRQPLQMTTSEKVPAVTACPSKDDEMI